MTEREWDKLFDLIQKAILLDGSVNEKAAVIRAEAAARGQEDNLEEFVAELREASEDT